MEKKIDKTKRSAYRENGLLAVPYTVDAKEGMSELRIRRKTAIPGFASTRSAAIGDNFQRGQCTSRLWSTLPSHLAASHNSVSEPCRVEPSDRPSILSSEAFLFSFRHFQILVRYAFEDCIKYNFLNVRRFPCPLLWQGVHKVWRGMIQSGPDIDWERESGAIAQEVESCMPGTHVFGSGARTNFVK